MESSQTTADALRDRAAKALSLGAVVSLGQPPADLAPSFTQVAEPATSAPAGPVGMVWVARADYDELAQGFAQWLPRVLAGGSVLIDGHAPGSDVEAAVRDHVPFARFAARGRIGDTLVLERASQPRMMILCGGMQGSGSTLVSTCFLQRADLDGVFDVDNPRVHQDFALVFTDALWVKMTIGSFGLGEIVDLYRAQGWNVRPLLVDREPREVLASMASKGYGIDGATADDPPLLVRLQRYRADLARAREQGWTVLDYADLLRAPEAELARACAALGLGWDVRMMSWPQALEEFAYPDFGSKSLRDSRSGGLVETIARYQASGAPRAAPAVEARIDCLLAWAEGRGVEPLPPTVFRGTRREQLETLATRLDQDVHRLVRASQRLWDHGVLGPMLKFWRKFVNRSLFDV